MKGKQKILLLVCSVIAVVSVSCMAAYALLKTVTETKTNVFASDKSISIDLTEPQWERYGKEAAKVYVPGQTIDKDPRENGVDNSDIVDMSEMYFSLADQTVSAAERYSEDIADNIHFIETITVIDMAGLLLLIIIQMIQAIIIVRKNKVLEQKAYLDAHTGLPNKSRCEEVFHDLRFLDRNVACIMFDLNNLKIANDTLGHSVGDQLIVNFANILRNVIPSKEFVGRYGGDEFVAVIRDMPKEDVIGVLEKLKEEVDDFNDHGKNIKISYAYGWAFSDDYTECTLRTLFDRADKHMYENKRLVKLAQQ